MWKTFRDTNIIRTDKAGRDRNSGQLFRFLGGLSALHGEDMKRQPKSQRT